MLVSGAEARGTGSEDPGNEDWIAYKGVRVLSRNMALLPLPVMHPKEGDVDRRNLDKGCMVAYNKATTYLHVCECHAECD